MVYLRIARPLRNREISGVNGLRKLILFDKLGNLPRRRLRGLGLRARLLADSHNHQHKEDDARAVAVLHCASVAELGSGFTPGAASGRLACTCQGTLSFAISGCDWKNPRA